MNYPNTILVTGCAGFVGSCFVKQFRQEYSETQVVGIDDFSSGRRDAVDPEITFYEGSILDEELLEDIFSKHSPEFVFHFAALPRVSLSVKNPRLTSQVNIVGTVSLLTAAKDHGVKRFIFSSSSSIYGGADKLPTTESENLPNPKSPYAAQKYAGEKFCQIFSDLYGLDTVCLRYFLVFGPGQYGDAPYMTVIAAWLEALYFPQGKQAFIEGDGSQSRDFCYIDNVVSANILAMRAERSFRGDVYNIAHGQQTTLNEVKNLIEKFTGKELKLEKREPRLGDVKHTHADIAKAKKELGYQPKVNFEEGLKRTIEWYESRKA